MQNGKPSGDLPIIIKILIMGSMVLTLLIPLLFIQLLIKERSDTRKKAEQEVIQSWGGAQTITGPMISVPYTDLGSVRYMLFMPDTLSVRGKVSPKILERGIYQTAVYDADLEVTGSFSRPDFSPHPVRAENIRWNLARLIVSLNSPLALREPVRASVGGVPAVFETEQEHTGPFDFCLSAPLSLAPDAGRGGPIAVSLSLRLKGGRYLSFVPIAENTSVTLQSSWPHPSFFGPPLPAERSVTASGFTASWNLVQYRFIPESAGAQSLAGLIDGPERRTLAEGETLQSGGKFFGVELMLPVDAYVKSDRSAKYGILFLLVPFIALLLFELFAKVRIHLVQYFLIGTANVVFYLLLISLSEHVSFDPAYFIAAGLTTLLTGVYAAAFLKSVFRTLGLAAVIALFYAFLYVILLSQDYALLMSAVGIFVILAVLMLLTRRVDWFSFKKRKSGEAPPPETPPAPVGRA